MNYSRMNFKTDYKIVSNVLSDHKKIIDDIKLETHWWRCNVKCPRVETFLFSLSLNSSGILHYRLKKENNMQKMTEPFNLDDLLSSVLTQVQFNKMEFEVFI